MIRAILKGYQSYYQAAPKSVRAFFASPFGKDASVCHITLVIVKK